MPEFRRFRSAPSSSPKSTTRAARHLLAPLLALVLGFPAFAAPPAFAAEGAAPAAPSLADPVANLTSTTLENGLKVHLLEDHHTPVVAFQVWVNAGSADESFYTGIAHLFEHMMFKGSKNVGEEIHAQLITERGGMINAYTSRDVTVYHEDVTRESLPLVIDLEAERFANLVVSPEILESERQVVIEERRLRTEDSPDGLAFEMLAALAWQAHPYRWPTIGWRSNIEHVGVEECRAFFDTYYAPNNLSIVIVGDFDREETLARIRRTFGPLKPAPKIPRNTTAVEEQRGERRAEIFFDLNTPILMAGWHAPATGHPDGEALDVASMILSEGRTSRLYRSLVYEQEKALYAVGGYMELNRAGLFYAQAAARPGASLQEVEALFMAEIDRVAQEGVSDEEVARARRQMEVGLVEGLGTNHALAARLGLEMVAYGRVRPLEERIRAIRAVTAADVQRVVRTYLRPEARTVVHVVAPPVVAEASAPEEAAGAPKGGAR